MRKDKEAQESSGSIDKQSREEEVVVLTRTDKFGNTRPVNISETAESNHSRRKKEKVRINVYMTVFDKNVSSQICALSCSIKMMVLVDDDDGG